MGGGGGAVVAAAAAAHQRRLQMIVDGFRLADATAADRARSLAELAVDPDQREVKELIRDGVLRTGLTADHWYLSEERYIARRSARSRQARLAMFAVLFIALAIAIVGMLLARGQSS
jgi:hypothetical protein